MELCDCTSFCGDDPRIKEGTVEPCHGFKVTFARHLKFKELDMRAGHQQLKIRDVHGYFLSSIFDNNEGVFCADLETAERAIADVEVQNGRL